MKEFKQLQGWGAYINTKYNMSRNTFVPKVEHKLTEKTSEAEKPPVQIEIMPQQGKTWNEGRFQIVINYCHNCVKHRNTSIHEEADFAEKCNRLADVLKNIFPNIEIQANYDGANNRLEYFDVYIRGSHFIIIC